MIDNGRMDGCCSADSHNLGLQTNLNLSVMTPLSWKDYQISMFVRFLPYLQVSYTDYSLGQRVGAQSSVVNES